MQIIIGGLAQNTDIVFFHFPAAKPHGCCAKAVNFPFFHGYCEPKQLVAMQHQLLGRLTAFLPFFVICQPWIYKIGF